MSVTDIKVRRLVTSRPIPARLADRLSRELLLAPKLSEREVDVLALYACGLHGDEVAGRLHITRNTVDSHRAHIRAKLGARTIAQAVAIALLDGHLTPELIR